MPRRVLRAMNRPSDVDMTRRLVDHARTKLSDLAMRTTLIVGYPGETEKQFQTLLTFVEEMEFDHVGVFTYSPEAGTKAATLENPVPAEIAVERRNAIMEAQQKISLKRNRSLIGSKLEVLIEGVGESEDSRGTVEPISAGRARRHAPEVDGMVFVPGSLPVGSLVEVEITDALPYDLWARNPDPAYASPVNGQHLARRHRPVRGHRSRVVNRSERRGQGRPVPMAMLAET